MLFSLKVLGPSTRQAWRGLQTEMVGFKTYYLYDFHKLESGIDHSLFDVLRLELHHIGRVDLLHRVMGPYLAVVAIAGVIFYFVRIVHLPLANQVLALTVAAVLLPPISHDYTLVHLYAPFVALTLLVVRNRRLDCIRSPMGAVFACFAVLFTPENYAFHGDLRLGGQVKALTLIVLFCLTLRYPFEARPAEDDAERRTDHVTEQRLLTPS